MAHLFKIQGNNVFPTEECLLIYPFKDIWERDTSKGKDTALREFAYIEFMSSMLASNPYKGYSEDVRKIVLVKDLFKGDKWSPDKFVTAGIGKINEFQMNASPALSLYASTIKAKEKLEDFFNDVDLAKINFKTGAPVYKPKELTSALLDVDKITASMDALKKKIEDDVYEAVKVKGQKEVSPFAKIN